MDYKNKKVLVCGMARSGVSSALLLKRLGAEVTVADIQDEEKLAEYIETLEQNDISTALGKNPDDILKDFDLIIVSPGIPCDLPFFRKAFDLLIPIWGEVELAYSVCENPVIAITGTNGKTTTTALTGEIMKAYKSGSEVVGNIGVPFTEKVLDMASFGNDAYIVVEISSFQLETAYTFRPVISAVLNITPDHLNRHKTIRNYTDIKERIFAKQRENDFTVLNYDDQACREMAQRTRAKVLFFSRLERLDEGVFLRGDEIVLKRGGYDEAVIKKTDLLIFGNHNIENVMAAVCIAACAGVPLDVVRQVLKGFKGVEHRIEFVEELDGVSYYNDSKATNTDSAIKALEAIDKPVLLIGGGKEKDADFSDWVKLFAGKVKLLVVLGETADKIIQTCKAYNFDSYEKVNSLKDAVELCRAKAVEGDCVLLSPACASFDMFDNYEQRGTIFKQYVRQS